MYSRLLKYLDTKNIAKVALINRKVNVYLSAEEAIEKGLADEVL